MQIQAFELHSWPSMSWLILKAGKQKDRPTDNSLQSQAFIVLCWSPFEQERFDYRRASNDAAWEYMFLLLECLKVKQTDGVVALKN